MSLCILKERAFWKKWRFDRAGAFGGGYRAAELKKHAGGVVSFFPLEGDRRGDLIYPCEERFKASLVGASDDWSGSSGRPAKAAGNGKKTKWIILQ